MRVRLGRDNVTRTSAIMGPCVSTCPSITCYRTWTPACSPRDSPLFLVPSNQISSKFQFQIKYFSLSHGSSLKLISKSHKPKTATQITHWFHGWFYIRILLMCALRHTLISIFFFKFLEDWKSNDSFFNFLENISKNRKLNVCS